MAPPKDPPRAHRRGTGWLGHAPALVLPAALLLTAGFGLYTSTGRDDAHITYWAAHALARFGEILNYNGDRVEQSSSLLHVILLATLRKITGADVVTLGVSSSILAGVGTLLLVAALLRRIADRVVAFAGIMLAACGAYFVYWSFGGLETTLVSLTGTWLVVATGDYLTRASRARFAGAAAAMGAFALVRPESPLLLLLLVAAAAAWSRAVGRPWTARPWVALAAAGLAVCAALFAFRLAYFGSAFPQPVAAKFAGVDGSTLQDGLRYLGTEIFGNGWAIAVSLLAAGAACARVAFVELRARRFDPHLALALLLVGGYTGFVVASGGDWMVGGRFLAFTLPLAAALVPVAVHASVRGEMRRRATLAGVATALVLVEAGSLVSFARAASLGTLRWRDLPVAAQHDLSAYSWFEKRNRINMRDAPLVEFIGELIPLIESRRPGPVVIMTGQMGMIPYHLAKNFFRRVRILDRRGLCDRTLTDCALADDIARDARGVRLEYIEYFEIQEALEGGCGLPRPDVIFDLRGGNTQIVAENGYPIVARQFGTISDAFGSGGEVEATGFVAVREELWRAIAPLTRPSPGASSRN